MGMEYMLELCRQARKKLLVIGQARNHLHHNKLFEFVAGVGYTIVQTCMLLHHKIERYTCNTRLISMRLEHQINKKYSKTFIEHVYYTYTYTHKLEGKVILYVAAIRFFVKMYNT